MFAQNYQATKFDTDRNCLVSYSPNRESYSKGVFVSLFLILTYLTSVLALDNAKQEGVDSVKNSLVCVSKDKVLTMQGFSVEKSGSEFIFSKGSFSLTFPQDKCSFLKEVPDA